MDWNTVYKYHFKYIKQIKIVFNRSELLQKQYDLYIKNTPNIYNNIFNKFFKNKDLFILVKNNYPYYLAENIEHYILWFNPIIYKNRLKILLNEQYISHILNRYLNNIEYICFMNVPQNQSITNIYHYQVFIKKEINK